MTANQRTNDQQDAPAPKLVLFDIDGTLMITQGASSRCMKRAGEQVLGPSFQWHPITVGTLDPQIFDQLAQANGVTPTDAQRAQYQRAYLDLLDTELRERQQDIVVLPGIERLVQRLHQRANRERDVILGVLTGNFRRATQIKLERSGLGLERFSVLACAEDGATRDDLPRAALRDASALACCEVGPSQTYILGDTPRDIQCAHANGCTPIAVATGHYSADQLRDAGAGVVFNTLSDTDAACAALGLG